MHFRILDFWRISAAMLVMIFHFLSYGPASAIHAADRLYSLLPLMDMFLMISGFLIMLRYADKLLLEPGSYAKFLTRRLARFYPLYFLTLIYFILVGVAVHLGLVGSDAAGRYDFTDLPANILLLQGWGTTDTLTFNYVGWTLSAEWFCYLTLPAVVLVNRRYGQWGLIALTLASILALEAAVAAGIIPFSTWLVADTWGAYRAFADFAIGACIAVAVRDSKWNLKSHLPGWAMFALSVVCMWNGASGYLVLALLAASIFLAALAERSNPAAAGFLRPFDTIAGVSFSIYLIHPVIASTMLGIVWRRILEPTDLMNFYSFWIIPIAMTIALALASTRYFEGPVAKFLNDRMGRIASGSRKLSGTT